MNESFLTSSYHLVSRTEWALYLMIISVATYMINRMLFPKYQARITFAFLNRYEANKLVEESNVLFHRGGYVLNLLPIVSLSMLVYILMASINRNSFIELTFKGYLGILLIAAVYFAARILLVRFFGQSLDRRDISQKFNQMWILSWENLGIYLLIPSLSLPFIPGLARWIVLIILWAVVFIWLVFTIIRELKLLQTYRVSLFYMFLYLCTLEILPLWWAIHTLAKGFN